MTTQVQAGLHRANHVPFFTNVGYHPNVPLEPVEYDPTKGNKGVPSNFLVWDDGFLQILEPLEYPKLSRLDGIDTLIVKVSSNITAHKSDEPGNSERSEYNIRCIVEEIKRTGLETVIVTGGALGLAKKHNRDLGYGQAMLYSLWRQKVEKVWEGKLSCFESLVTPKNIGREIEGYFSRLGTNIPIVNEKNAGEFGEGGNDEVAKRIAIAAQESGRRVLVTILTNVEGVYTKDAVKRGTYDEIIRIVKNPEALDGMVHEESSRYGTGGLLSKIPLIADMTNRSINVVLFNGQYCNHDIKYKRGKSPKRLYNPIQAVLDGYVVGTRFLSEMQLKRVEALH